MISMPWWLPYMAGRSFDTLLTDLDALITFIQTDLAMPLPVFRTLIKLKRQRDRDNPAWETINTILKTAEKPRTRAFQSKTNLSHDFEQNLLTALKLDRSGLDALFNTLPEVENVYDLYRLRDRSDVKGFFGATPDTDKNPLSLSYTDFMAMMAILDDIYKDWRRIYAILRTAGRRQDPPTQLPVPNLRANMDTLFDRLSTPILGDLQFPSIVAAPKNLEQCYSAIEQLEEYVHLSVEEFATIRAINAKKGLATPWEWQQVYALLEQAYTTKVLTKRWNDLKDVHAKQNFKSMILFALGDPPLGDHLPQQKPDNYEFLNLDPDKDASYLREQLFLEPSNFIHIQNTCNTYPEGYDPSNQQGKLTWEKVYQIIELAQRKKRGWPEPRAQIERWQNVYAAADATMVQVRLGPAEDTVTPRWRTFGASPQPDQTAVVPAAAGFAIASPLLALAEGERTIILNLGFASQHFDATAISDALLANPFRLLLSSNDGMIEINATTPATTKIAVQSAQITITLNLMAQAAPVQALIDAAGIRTPWPMLHLCLADVPKSNDSIYRAFQPLVLERVELKVTVSGLTQLALQHEESLLNPKKPFEPFGSTPVIGSSMAIAHPELCSKRLDTLTMQIDWLGVPDNLAAHYLGYTDYDGPGNPPNQPTSPIRNNTDFKAQLQLFDQRALSAIQPVQLFFAKDTTAPPPPVTLTTGAMETNTIQIDLATSPTFVAKNPTYQQDLRLVISDEPLNWSRYWQLELLTSDFQHAIYPRAAVGYANRKPTPFIVNPPYTPKIKRLALGYSASETINLAGRHATTSRLYHIEPFGYRELTPNDDQPYSLLPQHPNQGELYIGISGLKPPQNLAVLFQLAEGSADPDLAHEPVHWAYLDGNRWHSLEAGRMLSDTTNGLLNTGIITFDLPPVAPSTRLPTDLYWIQASIAKNSQSIADLVAIAAQAVSATFTDQNNAPDHLNQPLPANSISGLAEPLPEVRAIRQPYSSRGGTGPEQANHFYTRVSERLRHKNRALTSWDYERLILEAFPQIYKVKCLPVGSSADPRLVDQIQIIVIPDIRGKLPFDPFEPKVAADTLWQIEHYLNQHTPAIARFAVRNPSYIRLRIRLGVRFRPGFNPGYYKQALDQELQRFLAPWAYDQSAEIAFGGIINTNLIINFAEERPYVDYVAGIKLFANGVEYSTTQIALDPNAIFVSDRQHIIDPISEEIFQQSYFTGINYLQIELDFQVG
jgi:hypothetical protein